MCYFGRTEEKARSEHRIYGSLRSSNIDVICIGGESKREMFGELRTQACDIVIVAWGGLTLVPIARMATAGRRIPVLYDAFTSLWDTQIVDRSLYSPYGWRSLYLRFFEWVAFVFAELVLTDTWANARFLSTTYGIPLGRFHRLWVGADETIWKPCPAPDTSENFHILHLGYYIPLHGMDVIVRAASLVEKVDTSIRFSLVGEGQHEKAAKALARELGVRNIEFSGPVPPERAHELICHANLVLGVFGGTPKADRVIANKVFVGLSGARPVLTGWSPAVCEALTPGKDVLTCDMADAGSLAEAILYARRQPDVLEKVGESGRYCFETKFSSPQLSKSLRQALEWAIAAKEMRHRVWDRLPGLAGDWVARIARIGR